MAEITIGGTEGMVRHHGWWPYVPSGLTAAQIHTGFCVALRLIAGDAFNDEIVDEKGEVVEEGRDRVAVGVAPGGNTKNFASSSRLGGFASPLVA